MTQPINKIVAAIPVKSVAFQEALNKIRVWIKSWFDYVLTSAEFTVSYTRLENYIINVSHILPAYFTASMKQFLQTLVTDVNFFGNHHFRSTTTFGFIGSSIVEGMNQNLKYGDYKCRASMGIDKATENQFRLAENMKKKRDCEKAKGINESSVWSRSETKQFLTDYMEGLAIKNFDKSHNYAVAYVSLNTWLVARKCIVDAFDYVDGVMKCNSSR